MIITSIFHDESPKEEAHKIRRTSAIRFEVEVLQKGLKVADKRFNVRKYHDFFNKSPYKVEAQ